MPAGPFRFPPGVAGGIAGGFASGLAQAGFNRLFGPDDPARSLTPGAQVQPFQFGGLSGGLKNGRLTITSSAGRLAAVSGIQGVLRQTAQRFGDLRGQVRPGFGALTASRVGAIDDARFRAIGNLRENLARRRLQGSSFAQNAVIRAEREFGREEADVRARSFLEELDAQTRFTELESTALIASVERGITELNVGVDAGLQILTNVQSNVGQANRLLAELRADAAAGTGAFFEPISTGIGNAVEEFFNG